MLTKLPLSRSSALFLLFAVAVLVAALVSASAASAVPDTRQIGYRYVEQMRAGNGLVFNAGDRVLLTSDPAYLLLVGIVAWVFPWLAVQALSAIVFALCVVLGAVLVYRIGRKGGMGEGGSVLIAALYCAAWPLWAGFGTPAPLMSALALASIDLALGERWALAGLALVAALLCAPAAALLVLPLTLLAIRQGKAITFVMAVFIPLALAILALWLYYGPSLWDGLLLYKDAIPAEMGLSTRLLALLSLPMLAVAAWGGIQEGDSRVVGVCAGWMFLHLLMIGILLRTGTAWAYAPMVGPILILSGAGWRRLTSTDQSSTTRFVIVFRERVYHVTDWLRQPPFLGSLLRMILIAVFCAGSLMIVLASGAQNQPSVSLPGQVRSIGVSSTVQLPGINPIQQQSVVSFDGQLQPDAKVMLERADWQSLLVRYAPDALILNGTGHIDPKLLSSGDDARLDYRPVGANSLGTLYLRQSATGLFEERTADVAFGPDIRLIGLAIDRSDVLPGGVVRVRLDWQLERDADKPVVVDLGLASGEWLLAHSRDTFDPGVFKAGPYSTYHTLSVLDSAWDGPVSLEVTVLVNNGIVARASVATLEVKG